MPPALRLEIRKLASLSLPVAATQLSTMLLGFVDTVMVGRVSVEALAAASLANVWIFGTLMFAAGVVFGIDPLVAQAHGARDATRSGLALQRGLVLALVWSVPVALLWTGTGTFLRLAGQDPALAASAHRYTVVQIPSIPCFLAYTALRSWLQGRELMRPALWVILIANLVNALANWVLIFGHLGLPALGLLGAGLATSLTRAASLVGLLLWVHAFRLHRGAWVPWSGAALEVGGLRDVMRIGIPVAFHMGLEIWAFSGAALLAGLLGATALAAHTVALNLAALAFMMPLGISQGAVTRVGNLLGALRPHEAQRTAWLAFAMGGGVMCTSAVTFVVLRAALPRIYTTDPDVIRLCASILPIAAAFQVFDGLQVVGCGILRGMGRTRPAAVVNLISYWLIGIPLASWLGLIAGFGLPGVWCGLAIGLAVAAALLLAWVRVRGPASLAGAPVLGGVLTTRLE
jgi:MATE family multidrug resistance protein